MGHERNSLVVLGFVAHGGDVGAEGAAAEIVEACAALRRGDASRDGRLQRGEDAQAVALAERHQADGGGDEVGGEAVQVGGERVRRAAMPCARRAQAPTATG